MLFRSGSMNYNEDSDAEGDEGTGEDCSSGDSDAAYSDEFKLNTDEEDESEDEEEEGRDEVNQLDEISDCDDEPFSQGEVDLAEKISDEQEVKNIRHNPIPVPKHANPFHDNEMEIFTGAIVELTKTGRNPSGYGLLPEEWGAEGYPSYEVIRVGRARKEQRISLLDHTWRPRAELWGRALYLLNSIMYMRGDSANH